MTDVPQGAKAIRGEEEDIPSKIFPPFNSDKKISLLQASYLRIFDNESSKDWYNLTRVDGIEVPKGKETEVISGKKVKFY